MEPSVDPLEALGIYSRYYPLPESYRKSLLDSFGQPTKVETEISKFISIRTSDLPNVMVVPEFAWAAIAIAFAQGVGQAVGQAIAKQIISRFATAHYAGLSSTALREVAGTVRQSIEDAFFRDYMESIEAVRRELLSYAENGATDKLLRAESNAEGLMPHIISRGSHAVGGFVMLANLHLISVAARTELDASWKPTFNRLRNEYAGIGIAYANQLRERLEARIGQCRCSCSRPTPIGGDGSCSCFLKYNWDADVWSTDGDYGTGPAREAECKRQRDSFYNDLVIGPIQREVNPIVETCNTWIRT